MESIRPGWSSPALGVLLIPEVPRRPASGWCRWRRRGAVEGLTTACLAMCRIRCGRGTDEVVSERGSCRPERDDRPFWLWDAGEPHRGQRRPLERGFHAGRSGRPGCPRGLAAEVRRSAPQSTLNRRSRCSGSTGDGRIRVVAVEGACVRRRRTAGLGQPRIRNRTRVGVRSSPSQSASASPDHGQAAGGRKPRAPSLGARLAIGLQAPRS